MLHVARKHYHLPVFGIDVNAVVGGQIGCACVDPHAVVETVESVGTVLGSGIHVSRVYIVDSRPRTAGMHMHVVESAVSGDVAPGFVDIDHHIDALGPMTLIGIGCGPEQAGFHPLGQGTHSRIVVVEEIETRFIEPALGIGRNSAAIVALL